MIEIDGSLGEGGGQVLRTSLALAAVTRQELCVRRIRAKRRKPGLMRQHWTAARAVAEICGGELEGAELNSQELTLRPGEIRGGEFRFAVGSAGSVVLIAQTVLPLLLRAPEASHIRIEGGTHVPMAPVFDFFDRVFLKQLRRMGAQVEARLEGYGFYPAGGGVLTLEVAPCREWRPLMLEEYGEQAALRVVALSANIPASIAVEEVHRVAEALGLGDDVTQCVEVASPGPGNVVYVESETGAVTELFGICGEMQMSRQTVADRVAGLVRTYRERRAPVGRFLADQLLLPLALGAGGAFVTGPLTEHTRTNIEVIRQFLPVAIEVNESANHQFRIEVKR